MKKEILFVFICLVAGNLTKICTAADLSFEEIEQFSHEVDHLSQELSQFDISKIDDFNPTVATQAVDTERSNAQTSTSAVAGDKRLENQKITGKQISGSLTSVPNYLIPTTSNKITDAEFLKRYIAEESVKAREGFYYKILRPGVGKKGCREFVSFTMKEMDSDQQVISKGHYKIRCESLPPIFHSAINLLGKQGSIDLVTTAKNMYAGQPKPAAFRANKIVRYQIELE